MKKTLKAFIATTALLSAGFASAAVEVSFDKDLELLVANGEATGMLAMSPETMTLKNGPNQLVVRVSKLVSYSGEYKKFRSEPVVLTFDASDTELLVKPSRHIVREQHINGFDKNPSMKIEQSGQSFDAFHQGILLRSTGMMRDHVKELEEYNVAQGFVAVDPRPKLELTTTKEKAVVPAAAVSPANSKFTATGDNALILMQADYLRLSDDQKQTFLQWVKSQ